MARTSHSICSPPSAYQLDLAPNSENLIVSFSGLTGIFDEDRPFDFFMTTNVLGYNRIMLRDPYGSFYLKGIDSRGFEYLVSRLRRDIKSIQPKRTVFIGASAGAFAALVFGHILGSADYIHGFAPLTHFRLMKSIREGDVWALYNFSSVMVKLGWSLPPEHKKYLDLKPLLDSKPVTKTKTILHACGHCRDARRVRYLKHSPGVKIFLYPCDIHNVARVLVKSNCLRELLLENNLDRPEDVYRAFYGDFNGIEKV